MRERAQVLDVQPLNQLLVDSHLQFAVANANRFSTDSWTAAPTVIIELKFGSEMAENAAAITNAFPYRLARFSKYVAGIGCV